MFTIKYKKTLFLLLMPTVAISLFYIGLLADDPFGAFHDRGIKVSNSNMRLYAASAIRSGKYDSYVLGTSVLENSSARELEELFEGTRWANISISGGTFFERSIVLDDLFRRDKGVKNILYSLDECYLSQRKEKENYPAKNFKFMYDRDNINDLTLYSDCFMVAGKLLKPVTHRGVFENDVDFDRPHAWMLDQEHMCLFGGLDNWFSSNNTGVLAFLSDLSGKIRRGEKNTPTPEEEMQAVNNAIEYCDSFVLKYVKAHPRVSFYMVFPPYSRIRYSQWYQYDLLNAKIHEAVERHFVVMSGKYSNLFVFGLENEGFVDDIAFYKDTGHYHPSINEMINKSIQKQEHLLTVNNIESYISYSREKALDFDLVGLGQKVDEFLESDQNSNSD